LKKQGPSEYRKDIDGLRAISILAVVLFHAFPGIFPGGYVGVDVFFVISGYLITGIVLGELSEDRFSFKTFYQKRIVRLFPSLAVVLTAALIFGWFFLYAEELKALAKHAVAGVGFLSNFTLMRESGYFDTRSELKPLLHFWSLSIEEQFYLIWPLVLFLAFARKFVLKILVSIFTISIVINFYLVKTQSDTAFYFPASRFWELLVGAWLAYLQRYIPRALGVRERNLRTTVGLLLIASAMAFLGHSEDYPGWKAIIPCLGTYLILSAGSSAWLNKRVLSSSGLVFIGLISYPLYLWHWPLLSFGNLVLTDRMSTAVRLLMVMASIGLASATYMWVELPIKKISIKKRGRVSLGLIAVLLGIGTFAVTVFLSNGFENRHPEFEKLMQSKAAFAPRKGEFCNKHFPIELCNISKPEAPTAVLLGDSHASHHFPGLSDLYTAEGENLLLLAKSGTAPLLNTTSLRSPTSNLASELDFVLGNPEIKTVILAGFWSNYSEEHPVPIAEYTYKNPIRDDLQPEETKQEIVFEKSLKRTLEQLSAKGKNTVFVYDIPVLPFYLSECLLRPVLDSLSKSSRGCEITKEIAAHNRYRKIVGTILLDFPMVKTFDPHDFLCSDGKCFVQIEKKFMYSDEHHLSIEGSHALKPLYIQQVLAKNKEQSRRDPRSWPESSTARTMGTY
jgi:peptidoglycan/LPS O-acetylase OafA/YrhL